MSRIIMYTVFPAIFALSSVVVLHAPNWFAWLIMIIGFVEAVAFDYCLGNLQKDLNKLIIRLCEGGKK